MRRWARPRNALWEPDVRAVRVFIYTLAEPNGTVRYVGRSSRPEHRVSNHENKGSKGMRAWISALRARGEAPVLGTFCVVEPGEDAARAERKGIAYYLTAGAPLLNCVRNWDIRAEAAELLGASA